MVKKILSIVLWVLTGGALAVLFYFGRVSYLSTPLQGIDFQMEKGGYTGFNDKDTLIKNFSKISGFDSRVRIKKVNLKGVQQIMDGNPWIERGDAFVGLNDTLIIRASEYKPFVRVFNRERASLYITEGGITIPVSTRHTPRMLIASGEFEFPTEMNNYNIYDTAFSESGLPEVLTISQAIQGDDFLVGNIGQIYRNNNKEYELMVYNIPARILLGDTCNVDMKLERLKTLLKKYSGTEELSGYKTLDLRYSNQIVCTK